MTIGVFMAEGLEEIEGSTVVDLCRRAEIETLMISIGETRNVRGAHGIEIVADRLLDEVEFDRLDMIVLPGGMPGTLNLKACEPLMEKVMEFDAAKKGLAAICAAPMIFGHLGLLKGRKACCYPGMEGELKEAVTCQEKVCVSDHIITGRGVGTAIEFALAIVARFRGDDAAAELAAGIVYAG